MNQPAKIPELLQANTKTITHNELQEILKAISEAFLNADTWCKRVEVICGMLPIPPVNQMRYAGYHLSKFLSTTNLSADSILDQVIVNIDELRATYNHLLRAYYDSLDYLTQQLSEEIQIYENTFKELGIVVTDHFPAFFIWKKQIKQIEQFKVFVENNQVLTSPRVHEFALSSSDRKTHYQKIVSKIDELEQIQANFEAISICISTKAQEIAKKDNQFKLTIFVALVAIFIAIVK